MLSQPDVVGAAPTGDAPTTSERSTILLPAKVRPILEVWRYDRFRFGCPHIRLAYEHSSALQMHFLIIYNRILIPKVQLKTIQCQLGKWRGADQETNKPLQERVRLVLYTDATMRHLVLFS